MERVRDKVLAYVALIYAICAIKYSCYTIRPTRIPRSIARDNLFSMLYSLVSVLKYIINIFIEKYAALRHSLFFELVFITSYQPVLPLLGSHHTCSSGSAR